MNPVQIPLKWKYRRPKSRSAYHGDRGGHSGKHRSRARFPTDYNWREHVLMYGAGRGRGLMVHNATGKIPVVSPRGAR